MWVLASLSVDLNIPLGVGKHFETISTALSLDSTKIIYLCCDVFLFLKVQRRVDSKCNVLI